MKPRKTKMASNCIGCEKTLFFTFLLSLIVTDQLIVSATTTTNSAADGQQNQPQQIELLSSKLYRSRWPQADQPEASENFDTASSTSSQAKLLASEDNETVTSNNQHHKRASISTITNNNREQSLMGEQQQQQQFRSQTSYACGRAVATNKNSKFNDLMTLKETQLLNQNGGLRTNKYRPFEIRTPRIIGGDETAPGEFPWTVSIKLNGQPICGGSLIDRSWILTAAHCVVGYNPRNLTVRLGAYKIKDLSEQQTIESSISMFIVHKQYSMPRPFSNDIALLKIAEPVEFSDFIVPICLPTEDQVSNSLTNEIIEDYSKPQVGAGGNFPHHHPSSSVANELGGLGDDELGAASESALDGIVVSIKMSDKEIARCFKRLEQNYLNSIGLGSSSSTQLPPASFAATSMASPSIEHLLEPAKPVRSGQQQQQFAKPSARPMGEAALSTHEADTVLSATLGNNRHSYGHQQAPSLQLYRPQPQQQQPTIKVTFLSNSRPIIQAEQFFETPSYGQQRKPQQVYYDLPWSRSDARDSIGGPNDNESKQNNNANKESDGFSLGQENQQQQSFEAKTKLQQQQQLKNEPSPAIKLTSLPISKELLREIQSVGSMQSLTLGLQQNDLVALANDLSESGSVGGGGGQSRPDTAEIAANSDRERIITSTVGGNVRQFVRTSSSFNELDDGQALNAIDNPTRYSGMSGIVVGWGWVRENDNEAEQQHSRGYQSVTLQKVRLPILRNNDCEAWFRSQEKKITLLPSQFCAGFNLGGKDACRGDSGGPMIIEDNSDTGRYKLIGIVSAGIGCARPSLPGLYTRVASFIPWINTQVSRY